MDYTTFINKTRNTISEIMGDEAEVTLKTITKNNNVKLDGITIRMDGENISPTIYINDYYKQFLKEQSINDIAYEVIRIYQDNKTKNCINADFFMEYSNVEERIAYKLINYEENIELLEHVAHIQLMDLAIVFYCLVSSDLLGNATILIHNSHIKMWGKDLEQIYQAACKNSEKLLPVEIDNIETILKRELGEELEDVLEGDIETAEIPMYVISNKTKVNGAACILYKDVLNDFANAVKSDLYILPSSVHEIIVLPKSAGSDPTDLKQIVKETNDNHVEKEEILSYSVYEYSRKEEKVRILL